MARVFIDGFESGDLNLWNGQNGNIAGNEGTYKLNGTYAASVYDAGSNTYAYKILPAAAEYYFGLNIMWRNAGQSGICLQFQLSTTILLNLEVTNTEGGYFKITRGSGRTALATGTKVLTINTWYRLSLRVKIDPSAGVAVLKVDGTTDINFSGQTAPGSEATMDRLYLGGAACLYRTSYDDLAVDSTTEVGNTKIQAVVPTGAGATTGYTPSTGANWSCVDEKPASDTDYISVNTADAIDSYATENLAGTIGSVSCVQVQVRARYEGSTAVPNIAPLVRSSSTDYPGANQTLTASYAPYCKIWETDPATSAAWTESGVNAMEIGLKARA